MKRLPYLIGDFMWTAWDYIGECGIGGWYYGQPGEKPAYIKDYPWKLSCAGAIDLLGYPTGEALLAAAVWKTDEPRPFVGVEPVTDKTLFKAVWRGTNSIPSWSWKGCDGLPAHVEVYTRLPKVELFVNGKKMGEQSVKHCVARFENVTYQPGELKAVAIDEKGHRYSRTLHSATGTTRLRLRQEPSVTTSGEGNIVFVDVDLVGKNGEVVANDDRQLQAHVQGGELIGFGSASPITEDNFTTGRYTSYQGHALAVVRFTGGSAELTVEGEGLATAKLKLE